MRKCAERKRNETRTGQCWELGEEKRRREGDEQADAVARFAGRRQNRTEQHTTQHSTVPNAMPAAMDTFMTFISKGAYAGRREADDQQQHQNSKDRTRPHRNSSASQHFMAADMNSDVASVSKMFDDDVLNEFLNPNCFQQQGDLLDYIENENENENENEGNVKSYELVGDNPGYTHETTSVKQENSLENININDNAHQTVEKQDPPKTIPHTQELKLYEESKKHLMNVKFGLNDDSKYIHHSNVGYRYTTAPTVSNSEDPDVTTTLLPPEYQEAYFKSTDSFPYKLKLQNLPTHSRVETQIKLDLTVTPAPSQFLLHIPRDVITKPKFTLAENQLGDDIKPHLLYLDVFVVGAESQSHSTPSGSGSHDNKIKSCNVCKRCMRRELKRASRRKAGLVDDSTNWDINVPKRAIIINCKEIVSFPAPSGNSNERKLELLSRIVCYCRHHQELNGFTILMFLKNAEGEVVGKVASTPILIMDRKKSIKSGSNSISANEVVSSSITQSETIRAPAMLNNDNRVRTSPKPSNNSYNDSSSDVSAVTSTTTCNIHDVSNQNSNANLLDMMTSATPKSASNSNTNLLNTNGKKGMFSSLFSFDPSNILGDESTRQVKRQKRPWAQSESTTYFENINQQRAPAHNHGPNSLSGNTPIIGSSTHSKQQSDTNISIKREEVSPMSSDSLSPHNNMISSAGSVFSATPEQNRVYDQLAHLTPPSNTDDFMKEPNNDVGMMDLNDDIGMNLGMDMNIQLNPQDSPVIRRIIPAQGPIRGGIEITLLGSNFKAGMDVKFGSNTALATQCWSDSTIVTYLPPASQAGPVVVTFDDPSYNLMNNNTAHQIFTYTDDTDRQLIELALQIVGLKMNGKLEDAKNIAKRIVGNNQMDGTGGSGAASNPNSVAPSTTQNSGMTQMHQQLQLNWMAVASEKIKELSKSSLNHEEILIKFLNMVRIPNSLISSPNWAVCNSEGQTMLHLACFKNYRKLTRFLISSGSKIDYTDMNGFTPLHFAFISGNRKIINMLLKFKANVSNKLDNGIMLSEIADNNVLDLIGAERMYPTDMDFDDDDEDEDDDDGDDDTFDTSTGIESTPELSISGEIDDLEVDDYQLSYRASSRNIRRRAKKVKLQQRSHAGAVYGSEADNENDDTDSDVRYASDETENDKSLNSKVKETNSFGFNLWMAMKEAIKNKMSEISEGQSKRNWKKKITVIKDGASAIGGEDDDDDEEEPLPSYDDLFPNGSSLRSLMNFRAYGSDDDHGNKPKVQGQLQSQPTQSERVDLPSVGTSVTGMICEDDVETDQDVDMLANKLRTSIGSDTRLLFFWLPCMLLLLLIVIGNNLNIIKLENFDSMAYVLENVRETVGSFTLGKERFTSLINENINYGRERMEHLLNDVNGVVMTAVAGVGR